MKCRLTLLATAWKEPLPDAPEIGFCDHEPVEGQPFRMHAAPLEEGQTRLVTTSVIQKRSVFRDGQEIEFQTENSNYKWEFLGFGN